MSFTSERKTQHAALEGRRVDSGGKQSPASTADEGDVATLSSS